jgi:ribosomal protein S12
MIKYEIREICGDWALYEVRETETEGGEKCLLILNSRSNAEYVKAILEHEAKNPNAAVRYFPRAELMSDAEVLAVFRMCATDEVGA